MSLSTEPKNLIEQIKIGELKMRPRSYFWLSSALKFLASISLACFAIYLTSFILFYLDITHANRLLGLGIFGIRDLLLSLPLIILSLVVSFSAILLIFSEKYSFSYRNPLLYSVIAVIIIVTLGGYIVYLTPLHNYLMTFEDTPGNHMFLSHIYRSPRHARPHNTVIGIIQDSQPQTFIISVPPFDNYQILYDNNTRFVPADKPKIGDYILVHGNLSPSEAIAWEIITLPQE